MVDEAEPRLPADLEGVLVELVPVDGSYRHDEIDDAADHLRAALLCESVAVPVEDGRLAPGTWQSVLLVGCDGPRSGQLRVPVTET